MAYLDVISLADAKNYLRVDDTLTDDDAQITLMIETALQHIELATNVLVYQRDKTYKMVDGFVRVYDFPINVIVTPSEDSLDIEEKTLYTNYCYTTSDTTDLTLTVGYVDCADVPQGLKMVAYEIIELLYYEKQTGRGLDQLSELSKSILHKFKRFVF